MSSPDLPTRACKQLKPARHGQCLAGTAGYGAPETIEPEAVDGQLLKAESASGRCVPMANQMRVARFPVAS
jgi:hypothetical protein